MNGLSLPFVHLNLRFNPFGEPPLAERGMLAVVGPLPDLHPDDPVQLVGQCGRGKTTHLLALLARHPGAIYERLDPGQDLCRTRPPAGTAFLLDEAQRLRPTALRRLLAEGASVALGTHEDLSRAAGRPLRTVIVASLSVPRLRAIVDRRIEWARRAAGPVPVVPNAVLEGLVAQHGSNLRAIEWRLYDAIQRLEEPSDVAL